MRTNDPWKRLADSARARSESRAAQPDEMPLGFDTRVLACLRAPRWGTAEVWARLAWRALPVGVAVLLLFWMLLPTQPVVDLSASDEIDQIMLEVLNP